MARSRCPRCRAVRSWNAGYAPRITTEMPLDEARIIEMPKYQTGHCGRWCSARRAGGDGELLAAGAAAPEPGALRNGDGFVEAAAAAAEGTRRPAHALKLRAAGFVHRELPHERLLRHAVAPADPVIESNRNPGA